MGIFDTIEFPRPIKCKHCGIEHKSAQTKAFDPMMATYAVGDGLPKPFCTGIMKETLYCNHDKKMESSWDQEIFVVAWHGILIDVTESYEEAEKKLASFGFGDLLLMYHTLWNDRNKYRRKFRVARDWIKSYLEYEKLSPEEKERLINGDKTKLGEIHSRWFAESIAKAKSPLDAFEEEEKESDGCDPFCY